MSFGMNSKDLKVIGKKSRDDEKDHINPLLPTIAGIIESGKELTLGDIQRKIDMNSSKKITTDDVLDAIKCGIKWGVFVLKREFTVSKELTTKELKKMKFFGDQLGTTGRKVREFAMGLSNKQNKNVIDYVKNQREKRKEKLRRKKNNRYHSNKDYRGDSALYKFLCQRCKKSLEKDLVRNVSSENSTLNNSIQSFSSERTMPSKQGGGKKAGAAAAAAAAAAGGRGTGTDDKKDDGKGEKKEKSRLLVEKNPLETEPPYYDIFT